jgi:hypothetical protein
MIMTKPFKVSPYLPFWQWGTLMRRFKPPSDYYPGDTPTLDLIHRHLRQINSRLWRELRTGFLAACHIGLYEVRLHGPNEELDWRELHRRTVSSLARFRNVRFEKERVECLVRASDCIGQKLRIVKLAAKRKSDQMDFLEEKTVYNFETGLLRLSLLLRTYAEAMEPGLRCRRGA